MFCVEMKIEITEGKHLFSVIHYLKCAFIRYGNVFFCIHLES